MSVFLKYTIAVEIKWGQNWDSLLFLHKQFFLLAHKKQQILVIYSFVFDWFGAKMSWYENDILQEVPLYMVHYGYHTDTKISVLWLH